jgi:hypothetical protein
MTRADIIERAQVDGVTISLDDSGKLKVRGDESAVARWLPEIRQAKPELVRLLTAHQADVAEAQAERAATLEVDGRLPRDRAEAVAALAAGFYEHFWACPACRHGTQVGAGLRRFCPAGKALWARYSQAAGREVRP